MPFDIDLCSWRNIVKWQYLYVVSKPVAVTCFVTRPTCGSFRANWCSGIRDPSPLTQWDQSALSHHHCAFITHNRNPANSPVVPLPHASTLGPQDNPSAGTKLVPALRSMQLNVNFGLPNFPSILLSCFPYFSSFPPSLHLIAFISEALSVHMS